MNPARATRLLFAVLLMSFLTGCSALRTSRSTDASLTYNRPIRDPIQAVNLAQVLLTSTRLKATQTPRLVSVEKMTRGEGVRRIAGSLDPGESPDAPVWLVILQGEWQVIPPDPSHTITPAPPSSGCVYVLMDANEPGHDQVGGAIECGH